MEYGILGPLEVADGGRVLPLGGGQQRALLALLLLHRNEVVSTDRLIEDLWSGQPPATAHKIVQIYVSHLRKVLGEGRLVTRAPGYLLQVGQGQLDADRAARLLADGRRALGDGHAGTAADRLREALALWRGPPLADFTYEAFAQAEVGRLAALRLEALEERIEADLALGRHADLVPELAVLVREQPLRERPRGQLMLALYRCGRQAEALEAYRDGRRVLDQELGLQPSHALHELERRILLQDPSLDAPPRVEPAAESHGAAARTPVNPRRRGRALVLAGAALAGAAVVAATFELTRGGSAPPTLARNVVAGIDAASNRVAVRIPVGSTPTTISAGDRSVWVLNADDQTVSRIDPTTATVVRTFATGGTPTDLAVGAGAAWVGNGSPTPGGAHLLGWFFTSSISRIDLQSNRLSQRIELPGRGGAGVVTGPHYPGVSQIAVGRGAVWAADPDLTVSRISARTGRLVATVRGVQAVAVAAGREGVWVDDGAQTVSRIDVRSNTVGARIHLAGSGLSGIAVGDGAVWVADGVDGTLWRIDPAPDLVTQTIKVGVGATGVFFGRGAVWVTNWLQDSLLRIDPSTDSVTATIKLPGTPQGAAIDGARVWVSVNGGFGTTAGTNQSPLVKGVPALPPSSCGQVVYRGKTALQYLIASDLPLQGPTRSSTLPMTQAIQLVLAQHHFKAGRYAVGYQSCDDSTAQIGETDLVKCNQDARAYVGTRSVLGVIGPYSSTCARVEIPTANRAGLAMISGQTTNPGLTHAAPGNAPGEPGIYFPAGARTFVRIASPDDAQGAAQALLAAQLGLRRVYLLTEGNDYGRALVGGFRRAAAHVNVTIAGVSTWEPEAKAYVHLADRIARSGVDAVFFAGVFDASHKTVLLSQLRARLGPHVRFLAGDGFLPIPALLRSAGPAAKGLLVSYTGEPDSRLPANGSRFAEEFRKTQPAGVLLSYAAVYAAQATEVLLAAIARSDGSRSSVSRELLRTHERHGLLGAFRFDRNGDMDPAAFTIFRVVGGVDRNSTLLDDFDGSVIDRVVRVPAGVLR